MCIRIVPQCRGVQTTTNGCLNWMELRYENMIKGCSTTTSALHSKTSNFVPKLSRLHYNQKVGPLISTTRAKRLQGKSWENKRLATRGMKNEGNNGDITHPIQLNPSIPSRVQRVSCIHVGIAELVIIKQTYHSHISYD